MCNNVRPVPIWAPEVGDVVVYTATKRIRKGKRNDVKPGDFRHIQLITKIENNEIYISQKPGKGIEQTHRKLSSSWKNEDEDMSQYYRRVVEDIGPLTAEEETEITNEILNTFKRFWDRESASFSANGIVSGSDTDRIIETILLFHLKGALKKIGKKIEERINNK